MSIHLQDIACTECHQNILLHKIGILFDPFSLVDLPRKYPYSVNECMTDE